MDICVCLNVSGCFPLFVVSGCFSAFWCFGYFGLVYVFRRFLDLIVTVFFVLHVFAVMCVNGVLLVFLGLMVVCFEFVYWCPALRGFVYLFPMCFLPSFGVIFVVCAGSGC